MQQQIDSLMFTLVQAMHLFKHALEKAIETCGCLQHLDALDMHRAFFITKEILKEESTYSFYTKVQAMNTAIKSVGNSPLVLFF